MQDLVHVAGTDRHHRLVASRALAEGETILEPRGVPVAVPTRHSLQVGVATHLEAPPGLPFATLARDYPWRFLNHSCAPNAAFDGRVFVALRRIAAGEEVTFDYDTTEDEISTPFDCRCGSVACRGSGVRGFRFLDEEARRRLAPILAPHLLDPVS